MRRKLYLSPVNTEDCPCKGCQDRYGGCHPRCVRYIDWKQKHNAKLQAIQEQKDINDLLYHNQVSRNNKVRQEGGIKYGRRSK